MKLGTLLSLIPDLPPTSSRRLVRALAARDGDVQIPDDPMAPHTLDEYVARGAAAFQKDMRPVVDAVVSALHSGDLEALRGLRAMMGELLRDVNDDPTLVDLLAVQMGQTALRVMREETVR